LHQTLSCFEILILDEGSDDNTIQVASRINDPRVRIIKNEKGRSFFESIYDGVRLSKGEFIAIQSADDVARADRLEIQANRLSSHPHIELVTSRVDTVSKSGEKLNQTEKDWCLSPEALFSSLLFRNTICSSSAMFRKSVIFKDIEAGSLRPAGSDIWARFSQRAPIVQIDKALIRYRKYAERFDLDSGPEKFRKLRLKDITGSEMNSSLLSGFQGVDSLRYLSVGDLKDFAQNLGPAYEAILYTAPDFYSKSRMRRYLEEDFCCYRLALQAQGVLTAGEMQRRPNVFQKIKGALHYMARCHGVHWVYLLVRKDHF
jgi:glycosyltransferase involved in cell wall biosynthesis